MWAHGRHMACYEQFALLNNMAGTELRRYGTCVARGTLTRLDPAFMAFYRRCKSGEWPGYPRSPASVWPPKSGLNRSIHDAG